MSRIQNAFTRLKAAGQQALIPYITAGDPHPGATVSLMHALVAGGADIIELGVPFTDPSADGPVIQRAAERALAHGVSLRQIITMVAEFRKADSDTPVVLMGYANPVEAMGYEAFAKAASAAGIDGLLTVDLPPEEAIDRVAILKRYGIDPIFLLALTTPPARARAVAELAAGYVYYVSLKGVTGAANLDVGSVATKLAELRQYIPLPIGVGFGIRDAASARAVAAVADAVVIGSRIVQEFEAGESGLAGRLTDFVAGVRSAMNAPRA
ncbi:MAG: tryptophan synthase subunit alpha [Candidatus Dactylopiibacterium carminicum]|uniref:Tryptophan synthase alpha chain n=1 Tax=Candidatus Dactylopiibacterium carminicum TaxID=857335 RepID=A0A272EXR0_9RHOO|nr:tryptophan synthase subunit alpha [Candidatus Dactylopiibacterium carminicum]KAF7600528.1 tryptophan synthase subunit alpha [Candidatus Dactylopiibacterium carminicum]PAS94903.1 MAG: tryptophan synthase subunit alpha [Candidatus Dactylopiibacterium carminicum]PAT00534.1 MAG: tryptophan synthase subunit alpha [Candidatus Dactylopiibacterium carminicum]